MAHAWRIDMLLTLARAVFIAALAVIPAHAQKYPAGPIHFIVPFTPGTGMDTIARIVGQKMTERLREPVVVENKPGASGNIGSAEVTRAKADGHTLLVSANTILIAANLYKQVPYHPINDFAPISLSAWGTLLLAANPKANINSVQELIQQAKAKPGKINYGSPGVGTPHHMAMELFKDLTGIDLTHIPYKGSAGAVTDLLSGEINVMFVPIHVAMPHVKAGKLKALAVGSAKRHPAAPELATLQELGIKGAEVDMWYAFLAPKATPPEIVAKLNSELRTILAMPEVKESFDKVGLEAASSSPDELRALMQKDLARWAQVIKKNNITAE
jgi:tripartite-type tricarboxylate transporter receptor subunit TctC